MRRLGVRLVPVLALLSAAIVSACSSNSSTGPTVTVAQVVGNYSLVSLVVSGQAVAGASGQLGLTSGASANTGNYVVSLVEPTGPCSADTIADTGTFTVTGSTWSQTGQTTGTQVGTVKLSNDTLYVVVNTLAGPVTNTWVRLLTGGAHR